MEEKTSDLSEKHTLLPKLETYLKHVDLTSIPEDRKAILDSLASYIQNKQLEGHSTSLTFICTHNSRRSHMSQLWAQALAWQVGLTQVTCYSGGTEATAFNPRAVAAMKRAGFQIDQSKEQPENPLYQVTYANGATPVMAYSKTYDDLNNPDSGFAAVMTCSQADEACPFIPGAETRIALTYEDPKVADGTPYEAERYDERCLQIATELSYVFARFTLQ